MSRLDCIFQIAWLVLFLPWAESTDTTDDTVKWKRDFFHFGHMMWQVVGRNPLAFSNYGNYCGYGGDGIPVDPIDHCCLVHDACYTYAQNNSGCPSSTLSSLLLDRYQYEIMDDEIVCSKNNKFCSQLSCICDRALCKCLKEFIHLYDDKNRG